MLKGFEEHTYELTEMEMTYIPFLSEYFKTRCVGSHRAMTNEMVAGLLQRKFNVDLAGSRIRRLIAYLRISGSVPCLMASSKGYYVSTDPVEMKEYLTSLAGRISAIKSIARAIEGQLSSVQRSNQLKIDYTNNPIFN